MVALSLREALDLAAVFSTESFPSSVSASGSRVEESLPERFKTPKFNKYDGTGNPKTHLRLFANKLESLEGDALDWYSNLKPDEIKTWLDLSDAFIRQYEYNCELAPARTTLEGTKRKPSEDHKTYAKRWRKIAAKVEPPMTEDEIIRTFIKAHDPPYFEEIFRMTGCSFAAIINKLEEYDDFVKAGKIVNVSALKSQLEAMQNQGSNNKKFPFKKREEEVSFVSKRGPSFRPRSQQYPTYSPHYPYRPRLQPVYHTTINHSRPRPNYPNTTTTPFHTSPLNFQTKPRPPSTTNYTRNLARFRTFTNLGRPLDQLYEQLKAAGKIGTIPLKVYTKGVPSGYDPQSFCAYHSGAPGHSTVNCWVLKHKIQDMIEAGDIILKRRNEQGPSVSENPFPAHKDTIGDIITDEEFEQPAKYTVGENEVIKIV
ncbi:uncharacterized protein [Coffea arabica]|uniref:Retrotransposon gag domain-containing protein n=1 Tax=Coffea arabica TaxID=13443 RepID=A0ABM4W4D3_COFAR